MRHRPPYRLTFPLPRTLAFAVAEGAFHPCLHMCLVRVGPGGLVTVTGPSRERVFDQTRRFLLTIAKDHPRIQIAATLIVPAERSFCPGSRDPYTIALNADVVFSPGTLGVDFPPVEAAADVSKVETN